MERNGRATLRLRKSASPDARRLVHNFLPVLGALRGPERPNERAARRMADDSARKRGRLSGSPPPAAGSNAEAALAQARLEAGRGARTRRKPRGGARCPSQQQPKARLAREHAASKARRCDSQAIAVNPQRLPRTAASTCSRNWRSRARVFRSMQLACASRCALPQTADATAAPRISSSAGRNTAEATATSATRSQLNSAP